MWDFGVVPRPSVTQVLLRLPAVQEELKITEAQKKEQDAIAERRVQKMQKARAEIKDRAKFREARDAIFEEAAAAERAILTPAQRERLDQIQLQAQGPLAFSLGGRDPGSSIARIAASSSARPSRSGSGCPPTKSNGPGRSPRRRTPRSPRRPASGSPGTPRTGRARRTFASWSTARNSGPRSRRPCATPAQPGTRPSPASKGSSPTSSGPPIGRCSAGRSTWRSSTSSRASPRPMRTSRR